MRMISELILDKLSVSSSPLVRSYGFQECQFTEGVSVRRESVRTGRKEGKEESVLKIR